MRKLLLLLAALGACHSHPDPWPEPGVPQQITVKARGLFTQPSEAGVPDGALAQADNVVITRDGQIETRRGMAIVSAHVFERLFAWKSVFLAHDGASLWKSTDANGATWSQLTGSVSAPSGDKIRFAQSNSNAYFTAAAGPYRLDGLTGTPERHGIPDALDAQATVAGSGGALVTNAQAGYRVLFGKIDANGATILGAPSSRAVVANATGSTQDVTVTYTVPQGLPAGAFVQGYRTPASATSSTDPGDEEGLVYQAAAPTPRALTQLSRAGSTVTATAAQAHGYAAGITVRVPQTVQTSGTLVSVGADVAATSPDGVTWTARTIPSGTYVANVWGVSQFVAVGDSVAATSPDGITWTSRTIPAGAYLAVAWTGSLFVAVGQNVCATSPDGITWTSRTIPAQQWQAVGWNGSILVAVGAWGCATSPDGITWTSRTIPSTHPYVGIAWTGSLWVALAQAYAATSSDGVTWTQRTMPAATYTALAWNGATLVAAGVGTGATSSDGVTWTQRTMPAGAWSAVGWNGSAFAAVQLDRAASSPDGITWTSRTIPAGLYWGLGVSGTAQFPAGEKVIASVPSDTTFTYSEAGGAGTVSTTQTVTPLTGAFLDQVPSAFIGATIYTAPSQYGMQGSASQIMGARDIAQFRDVTFFANITYPSSAELYMLAVGGSSGVQNGDTITIDGLVYTAGASESISGRQFQAYTSGTPAQNIYNTSESLLRVINRTLGNTITARDISDPNGVPGHLLIQESNPTTTTTVAVSRAASWSIVNTKPPTQQKNEIRWSQPQQPDVVPLLNYKRIGSADSAILRIAATRSALFILKEDGVWILSGYSSPWQIDPFDPTVQILAPDSVAVLDNQVYGLTRNGVMRISDTGVSLVSRPIEDKIGALLADGMRDVTASVAFGVAYQKDHKYLLWVPSATTDTEATQAYVYDTYTDAWTRRTDAATHGVENADDLLYLATPDGVKQERKSLTRFDLADDSWSVSISSGGGTTSVVLADATNAQVGDALCATDNSAFAIITGKNGNTLTLDWAAPLSGTVTLYRAIAAAVQWTPRFGGGPGTVNQFSEVSLVFRNVYFARALLGYSTSFVPTWSDLALSGSDYGFAGTPAARFSLRSVPDLEHIRAPQMSIRWQHAQALSPAEIEALSVMVQPLSVRVGR